MQLIMLLILVHLRKQLLHEEVEEEAQATLVKTYQIMLQLTTLQNQQNLQIILMTLILLKYVLSNVIKVTLGIQKMLNVKNQMLKLILEIQIH